MKYLGKKLVGYRLYLFGMLFVLLFLFNLYEAKAAQDDIDADYITGCSYSYDGTNMRITYSITSSKDPKPSGDSQRVCGGADTLITGTLNVDGANYGPIVVGRFCEKGDWWSQRPGDTSFYIGPVASGAHSANFSVTFYDLNAGCANDSYKGVPNTKSCQPATFDKDGMLNLPCNASCTADGRCASGYCFNGQCRNRDCQDSIVGANYSSNCICPAKCNENCGGWNGASCASGLTCMSYRNLAGYIGWAPVYGNLQGTCFNSSCPGDTDCICDDCNTNPGPNQVSACAMCDASNNPYVQVYWNCPFMGPGAGGRSLRRISPNNLVIAGFNPPWSSTPLGGYGAKSGSVSDKNSIQNGVTYRYSVTNCSIGNVTVNSNSVTPNCAVTANGSCGSAINNGQPYAWNAGGWAGALCSTGTAVPASVAFPSAGSSASWVCQGSGGGLSVPCSASRDSAPAAGACGGANNHNFAYNVYAYTPSLNQCNSGTSSNTAFPAQGGTAFWVCQSPTGNSPQCRATRSNAPVNGQCGNAAGRYLASAGAYRSPYCSAGRAVNISSFPNTGQTIDLAWTCQGLYGGSDVTCSVSRDSMASPICPSCGTKDIQISITVPDIACPGCP